ncbi:hypothetical protein B0H10DRAFT_2235431 [Mycena sp. CBHHK59/15]|nr:hypothetical protein B0H10DRAFT_2235431 [Mycena sp. CBHHK59/15]
MNVDEDGSKPIPATLKFKKSGKESARTTAKSDVAAPAKPKKSSAKHARTKEAPFHEESFLTNAVSESAVHSPGILAMVADVESIAQATNNGFLENSLAMRKHLYYVNTNLAIIHEIFCSLLLYRAQVIEEGQALHVRLKELAAIEPPASGLDMMTP